MLELEHVAPQKIRPLLRSEYDRLVELGVFEDEKVELLYGRLVTMSPQNTPHAWVIEQLTMLLVPLLVGRARVRIQSPFVASEDSEPEPDFAIVPPGDYLKAHPDKALLLVEVAQSSLNEDRLVKGRLYATAGVPEYWLVNLEENVVEVHRAPKMGRYTEVATHGRDKALSLSQLPDVTVQTSEFLPK